MNENRFIEEIKKIGIDPTSEQLSLLKKYAEFLKNYNSHTNLTAITNIEDIYLKHFYDSLLVTKYYDFTKISNMIDIGSGAGFPGVVLKIFFPNLDVVLLDSNGKKTRFLEELINTLKLKNIIAINDRAENYAIKNRHKFDVSIARAVSELRIISELCLPLTKVDGTFIAMKAKYEEELKSVGGVLKNLSSSIESINETKLPIENSIRSFIVIKVNKKIDNKYPRPYDQIIKKELK